MVRFARFVERERLYGLPNSREQLERPPHRE
jgi:hypothetical protein